MKIAPLIFGFLAILPSGSAKSFPFPDGKKLSNHKVEVQEVIQTTNYTYLHVNENDTAKWLAVPKMQASKGEIYYYLEGLPMTQFESKELHRTFDVVLFLGGVSTVPIGSENSKTNQNPHAANASGYTRKSVPDARKNIKLDMPGDCVSISDLYSHKDLYAGKTVKVKGEVTKYNGEIMNKNWIHLQDGTENNGKYDLTVTSSAVVKVGDVVTLEGKITLNKDFGYGYQFEVMMEDAVGK